ncbi:MAG: helix-turn-helix domain-containing protein [Lachnospiraceae bacterium]
MDTKKIGAFLKQCRKGKNLTQEQFAEKYGVSARIVFRWETGSNMPDLNILVELAD